MNHEFSLETKQSETNKNKWQIWACHNSCYHWYTGPNTNEHRWMLFEGNSIDECKAQMDYFRTLFGFSK